jgi:hypothetical protein
MERWKVCPECGSNNIHCDIGVNRRTWLGRQANFIFLRPDLTTTLDLFVCIDCGNMRAYIGDADALETIKYGWPRADSLERAAEEG